MASASASGGVALTSLFLRSYEVSATTLYIPGVALMLASVALFATSPRARHESRSDVASGTNINAISDFGLRIEKPQKRTSGFCSTASAIRNRQG